MPAVSSPCVKLCVLDAGRELCRGCGRTLAEIGAWATLDEKRRLAIMAGLPARLAALDDAPPTAAGQGGP